MDNINNNNNDFGWRPQPPMPPGEPVHVAPQQQQANINNYNENIATVAAAATSNSILDFIGGLRENDERFTSLSLPSNVELTRTEMGLLTSTLKDNAYIQSVTFPVGFFRQNPDLIRTMFESVLPSLQELETLRVSHNNLTGEHHAEWIANLLKVSKNLKSVSLSNNKLGDVGCKIITTALSSKDCNSQINAINLSHNDINAVGATALANVLTKNKMKLRSLDIAGNSIGNDGNAALAKALSHNDKLSCLGISLTEASAHAFEEVLLHKNCTLVGIDVEGLGSRSPTRQKLVDLCRKNCRLQNTFNQVCDNIQNIPTALWPRAFKLIATKPDYLFKLLANNSEWYEYGESYRRFENQVYAVNNYQRGGRLSANFDYLKSAGILKSSGPKKEQIRCKMPDYFSDKSFLALCWTLFHKVNKNVITSDEVFNFLQQHVTPLEEDFIAELEGRVLAAFPKSSRAFYGMQMLLVLCKKLRREIFNKSASGHQIMTTMEQYELITIVLDFAATTEGSAMIA